MGNRATLEVINQDYSWQETPCYIYVHWSGSPVTVTELVKGASSNMRKSDVNYATARLIAHICNYVEGGLSVGVQNNKEDWDNGHYVIDMSNGNIKNDDKLIADGIQFGNF